MIICIDEVLDQMNLATLADLCTAELRRCRRKETGDEGYCLELLRRAIQEQEDDAWTALQHCFSDMLCCWVRTHSSCSLVLQFDTEENYVAQTMARFWCAVHDSPIAFTSLAALLNYLHATLNGILIDALRMYRRSHIVPLPEPGFPGEPETRDTLDSEGIWQSIQPLLSDARESRVAYLLYYCGLKPREIVAHCPGEFSDVKEIYCLNRNFIERLRRNRERLNWLLGQYE
ncbi:MAG TPA: hypothetical protein VFA09_06710 [Ktedonobacteraceae bacterium]|jgi:DNA-directed RNA polymerase specialized sigma24 family protein|nr:hypothetical protein [Ktedonobacteraceae bacterium]